MSESFLDPEGKLSDELEAWGVEPEALLELMLMCTYDAITSDLPNEGPVTAFHNQFLSGFNLGIRVAMEVELRRQAEANQEEDA